MRAPLAWLASLLFLALVLPPRGAGAVGADGASPPPLWGRAFVPPPGVAGREGVGDGPAGDGPVLAGGLPVQDGGAGALPPPVVTPFVWTPFLRDAADPPPADPLWLPGGPPPTALRGRPPTARAPPPGTGPPPGERDPMAPLPPTATLVALAPDPPPDPRPEEGIAWPIGEPATLALLGAALAAFGLMRRPA
jgi:hypothetical protein